MTGHVERIEKALNGGNRFRRADVSELLADVISLRTSLASLADHRVTRSVTYPAGLISCAGLPACHHCWAAEQLKRITAGSGERQ